MVKNISTLAVKPVWSHGLGTLALRKRKNLHRTPLPRLQDQTPQNHQRVITQTINCFRGCPQADNSAPSRPGWRCRERASPLRPQASPSAECQIFHSCIHAASFYSQLLLLIIEHTGHFIISYSITVVSAFYFSTHLVLYIVSYSIILSLS